MQAQQTDGMPRCFFCPNQADYFGRVSLLERNCYLCERHYEIFTVENPRKVV